MKSNTDGLVYPTNDRSNMLDFMPKGVSRVLEVGCNTGAFGRRLKEERSIEVWGLEPNSAAAAIAEQALDKVLNQLFTTDADLPDRHFDAIVFNDVLEHMADPWAALRLAADKLREGGSVVASIPNLLQIDNLLHLLRNRDFRYEQMGIRDRTHLRFFTRTSAKRLFEESGFEVTRVEGINEEWWTPSLSRRLAFHLLSGFLEETRYTQVALVGRPKTLSNKD